MKIISFIIVAAIWVSCSDQPKTQQSPLKNIPVITVKTDTATTYSEYPSSIEGTANVEIRPEVSGKIGAIYIDEGQYVQKGQLMFKIDDHSYRERLRNAKASLHAAQAQYRSASIEVEKLAPLVKNNVVSSYQLKTAQAAQEMAKGTMQQMEASVGSAEIELGYTSIKAPANGYLGRLSKKKGSVISPLDSEPITILSDIQKVHVYFSMSEKNFMIFRNQYAGESIEAKLKNMPAVDLILSDESTYPVAGRIDMVDGQFNKNTGSVTLRAVFQNPDRILRSGNTGKIRVGHHHQNIAVIPQAATMEIQDKTFVFVVDKSNQVSKQLIKISGKDDDSFFVNGGIVSGTRIITAGIGNIQEGEKIIPQQIMSSIKNGLKTKIN